ncbi:prepilin peptidase [Oceanicaulis sp.]|uniref:prepilin peptidase n=1 Tax=Oceanicaulis sp. TaxID=1924941 RepID=UPI003BA8C788
MTLLTGLALVAGVLASLSALRIDRTISVQQTGSASRISPVLCGGAGGLLAVSAYVVTRDLIIASALLAAMTALSVAVSMDWRFGLLADLASLIIALAALVSAPLLTPGLTRLDMMIAAALAMAILALAGLYGRVRRGEMGLGGGDIVLVGALGLWCPPVTAALGVAIGAALTLVLGVLTRARRHTRLPFAPGLAAGFVLAFIVDRVS